MVLGGPYIRNVEQANERPRFDPETVTGWTLVRTYQLMARRFYAVLATVDLTPTHFGVLMQLSRDPGSSQAALARSVFMTPQAMGELLTGLETQGLITRSPGAPGRPIMVTLTDTGRDAVQRAIPVIAALNEPTSLGLSNTENVTLNALLHKVRAALESEFER
jgi:DNA-binding MarR family transcriptional regulator